MKHLILAFVLSSFLTTTALAASQSKSCSFVEGQWNCQEVTDESGNFAHAQSVAVNGFGYQPSSFSGVAAGNSESNTFNSRSSGTGDFSGTQWNPPAPGSPIYPQYIFPPVPISNPQYTFPQVPIFNPQYTFPDVPISNPSSLSEEASESDSNEEPFSEKDSDESTDTEPLNPDSPTSSPISPSNPRFPFIYPGFGGIGAFAGAGPGFFPTGGFVGSGFRYPVPGIFSGARPGFPEAGTFAGAGAFAGPAFPFGAGASAFAGRRRR